MLRNKIIEWSKTLMIPQDNLGGMPICPFAKKAMANDEVEIELKDYDSDENLFWQLAGAIHGWKKKHNKKLLIFAAPEEPYYFLYNISKHLMILVPEIVILVGHPDKPTVINGVTTTFPDCGLFFIQRREYLEAATESLKKTNYYNFWTKQQLDEILNWRENGK